MPEAATYRRLTPVTGFLWSRYSLWLTHDHILLLRDDRYREVYKRFFFKDVQSLRAHVTGFGTASSWILGLSSALSVALTIASLLDPGMEVLTYVLGALSVILITSFACNFAMGRTCRVIIRTAVQTTELPCISRVKRVEAFFRTMQPLIEGAQGGGITPEMLGAGGAIQAAPVEIVTAARPTPLPPPAPAAFVPSSSVIRKPPRQYRGYAHDILFILLLVDTIHTGSQFLVTSKVIEILSLPLAGTIVISAIIALVRQSGTNLFRSIKLLAWAGLSYVILAFAAGIAYGVGYSIYNEMTDLHETIPSTVHGSMTLYFMYLTIMVVSAFIGAFGLYLCNTFRKTSGIASSNAPRTPDAATQEGSHSV